MCVYMYMYMCVYVCMYVCMYVCICVYMYTHVCISVAFYLNLLGATPSPPLSRDRGRRQLVWNVVMLPGFFPTLKHSDNPWDMLTFIQGAVMRHWRRNTVQITPSSGKAEILPGMFQFNLTDTGSWIIFFQSSWLRPFGKGWRLHVKPTNKLLHS